jgi:hypothetical protein
MVVLGVLLRSGWLAELAPARRAVIPAARAWVCLPAGRGAPGLARVLLSTSRGTPGSRLSPGPITCIQVRWPASLLKPDVVPSGGASMIAAAAGRCGPGSFPLPPRPVNPQMCHERPAAGSPGAACVAVGAGLGRTSRGAARGHPLTAHDDYQAERAYCIASTPGEPLAITVEWRNDGEVSSCLAEGSRTGELIEVRGPVGSCFVSGLVPAGRSWRSAVRRRATAGRPAAPFAGRKPGPAAAAVVLAELGRTGRCWPGSRGRPRRGRCPASAGRRASRGPSRPAWSRGDIPRSGSAPDGPARPGSEWRRVPLDDNAKDGDAIGGLLIEVFGGEMTAATGTCGSRVR